MKECVAGKEGKKIKYNLFKLYSLHALWVRIIAVFCFVLFCFVLSPAPLHHVQSLECKGDLHKSSFIHSFIHYQSFLPLLLLLLFLLFLLLLSPPPPPSSSDGEHSYPSRRLLHAASRRSRGRSGWRILTM